MKFWHLVVVSWIPVSIGFLFGGDLFRVGVLGTLVLYGVVITALREEVLDE